MAQTPDLKRIHYLQDELELSSGLHGSQGWASHKQLYILVCWNVLKLAKQRLFVLCNMFSIPTCPIRLLDEWL